MMKAVRLSILIASFALSVSGCMENLDSQVVGSAPQASNAGVKNAKSIASLWTGVSTTENLDFRSYRAGTSQTMKFEFENGMTCECLAQSATGDSVVLSQCKMGAGSAGDPGCSTFADSYNLQNTLDAQSNSNLKVCDSKSACALYR